MTDTSANGQNNAAPKKNSLFVQDARLKRRKSAEKRFQWYGIGAISIGCIFLVVLLTNILMNGSSAFRQTFIDLPITLNAEEIEAAEASMLKTGAYKNIIYAALEEQVASKGVETEMSGKDLGKIMSDSAPGELRGFVLANPDAIGTTVDFSFFASSRVDGYFKGRVERADLVNDKNLDAAHLDIIDQLKDAGIVGLHFNAEFIFGADASDNRPEQAGMGLSILGSFYMMIVVLLLALPIGVGAAIYLEEFAPQSKFTDVIEVNISNLAAVPSIVFGILGLAIFIQTMHFTKSAPLVGGLVLTLMTLPTIIISTRAALKAVPPSIREAALGLGASRMQAVFDHVLPLAMPGILTGTIIGLAQALGETAPLLLIGMVGFLATNTPESFIAGFDTPNSAMPAQIYQWASRADPAFYERAWGGIIILLFFLLAMNIIAVILRRKFERRW